jgi:hypothetical protein
VFLSLPLLIDLESKDHPMDAHEVADELGQPAAQELLTSALLARLAYNGSDDLPRVIPIGFHWTGHDIVVCTAPISPKVRALAARPNVAVTIDVGSTPAEAKALLVRGVATIDIVDGIPPEFLAATAKALAADQLPEFAKQAESMYKQMARIAIEPQWARFYDFGAGRLPAFLTELARNA